MNVNAESHFKELSHQIANDFIQSIVFLDDEAFKVTDNTRPQPSIAGQNDFNALEISQAFAKEQKICAVYCPKNADDISDFTHIAKKADVTILDWYINLTDSPTKSSQNPEEDADENEPRGQYTKKIIHQLVSNNDSLKLIIVFTGETDLSGITEEIKKSLPEPVNEVFSSNINNCFLKSKNIKILIRAKSNLSRTETKEKFKHNKELKDKVVSYEELPQFVLNEFTEMTLGILPNIALQSLTTIRKNTDKILSHYSKELDAAYLGHKVLLPLQTDAEPFLIELFTDMLLDLLNYQPIAQNAHKELIPAWITHNIADRTLLITPSLSFSLNKDNLQKLISSEANNISQRVADSFDCSRNSVDNHFEPTSSTKLFLNEEEFPLLEEKNIEFAKLTQHKSLFLPKNVAPLLTLGTIIQCKTTEEEFFLCIQQSCDSVRIAKDEKRRFLFLPLENICKSKKIDHNSEMFNIITPDNIKLKLPKKTHFLRTIKFSTKDNQCAIIATKDANDYTFEDIHGQQYKWILDIKTLRAQKIAVDYASSLARVGINESEWLRRRNPRN